MTAHEARHEHNVRIVKHGEVDRFFGRLAQVQEIGHAAFDEAAGAGVVIAEIERLHRQLKALGVRVLAEITELGERVGEALGGAHVEPGFFRDLRQAEVRPATVKGSENPEGLFDRLHQQGIAVFSRRFVFVCRSLLRLARHQSPGPCRFPHIDNRIAKPRKRCLTAKINIITL
ncbi:hypothetical protein D9M72_568660 [compost metagenome]